MIWQTGDNLVEADGGAFQPIAQISPGHKQTAERVGKAIKIGDVTQAQRALWDIGEMRGAAAAAGLERGRGGEQRQPGMRAIGQGRSQGAVLRAIDEVQDGIVAQEAEVAVEGGLGLTDFPRGKGCGVAVGAVERGTKCGAWRGADRRQKAGMMPCHAPALGIAGQHQVKLAQMVAAKSGHQAGCAVECAVACVGAGNAMVICAGKAFVAVACKQSVDARQAGERTCGVFHHRAVRSGIDAGMGHEQDQIGAQSTQGRHPGARALDHVAHIDPA